MAEVPTTGSATHLLSGATRKASLSRVPFGMIIRSLITAAVFSSPVLLPWALKLMECLTNAQNPFLNLDNNPLVRFLLKRSIYAQFCAGENPTEVCATIDRLKGIGFSGVILGYAKEATSSHEEAKILYLEGQEEGTAHSIAKEVEHWAYGTLQSVALAKPGDFVAIKLAGAGQLALYQLSQGCEPYSLLYNAIDDICALAQRRGICLLFDAEQHHLQTGIDNWTMIFARKYNTSHSAIVFGTYQAYKKITPSVICRHLTEARDGGFTLGVKLVRGAYLQIDPRHCFFDTKGETDACYNDISASLLTRQWGSLLNGTGQFPSVSIMLATHNAESIRRVRAICSSGGAMSNIVFAQLQGMADDVSYDLIEAGQGNSFSKLPVFKYLVWGTTRECMRYLLRRAQENKDAIQSQGLRNNPMWTELVRRCKAAVGLTR